MCARSSKVSEQSAVLASSQILHGHEELFSNRYVYIPGDEMFLSAGSPDG